MQTFSLCVQADKSQILQLPDNFISMLRLSGFLSLRGKHKLLRFLLSKSQQP